MTSSTPQLAPRCPRCTSRHLVDLPCWAGRYAQRVTARVLAEQGNVCWLCGKAGANSADHVVPRAHGGTDEMSNLRPACVAPCNSARGMREPFRKPAPLPPASGRTSTRWDTR